MGWWLVSLELTAEPTMLEHERPTIATENETFITLCGMPSKQNKQTNNNNNNNKIIMMVRIDDAVGTPIVLRRGFQSKKRLFTIYCNHLDSWWSTFCPRAGRQWPATTIHVKQTLAQAAAVRDQRTNIGNAGLLVWCNTMTISWSHCIIYSFIRSRCITYSFLRSYCITYSALRSHCITYSFIRSHCIIYSFIRSHCITYSALRSHCITYSVLRSHCITYSFLRSHCITYSVPKHYATRKD